MLTQKTFWFLFSDDYTPESCKEESLMQKTFKDNSFEANPSVKTLL